MITVPALCNSYGPGYYNTHGYGHYYECEPACGLIFWHYLDYEDHLVKSRHHHYCTPCHTELSFENVEQTYLAQSPQRVYCRFCQTDVVNILNHHQECHMQCPRCNVWCKDMAHFYSHCQADHSDVYCAPCRRLYRHPNNLIMHLKSSTHTPKQFTCPQEACRKTFISQSALIAHFEASACPSGVELEDVDGYFAHQCDYRQLFVRPELIFSKRNLEIPSHIKGSFQCPECPKVFAYAGQITAHFNSPMHKNHGYKPYACPSASCGHATFYSLSGLALHQEKGNCDKACRYELQKLLVGLCRILARI
ncbi:hypothetical protein Pst134EA_009399 [Puccinia striiformis f. sp. tritici]|nr:hypothetical protein Pst134EA_009399 [Puccinia striiformis f. sp. tritici]KAI9622893.1 hypothetical protein H4Q26_014832 [Puccinia striiformis f. sp. tritici PST-130]KNE90400.1 hypothetical protein PSTG_16146 [Puccinia striiformis f. sp. tritici PST-78]POW06260.1 hypothetical protein PSHT_10451 [Puccinia striiformis]KAH9458161.1 hypothetical protein Pst134EB_010463 [Puccinia striiformis f. sp. tritici]KAH9468870.1 hypothetical protein Pst134EA_009399 [Puccinia striiformis f. sp. tritici]